MCLFPQNFIDARAHTLALHIRPEAEHTPGFVFADRVSPDLVVCVLLGISHLHQLVCLLLGASVINLISC